MDSLQQTLVKLAQFLKKRKIPYMVIGGVANLFWGIPRTTLDIDVTIKVQEKHRLSLTAALRKTRFRIRVKHPLDFIRQTNVLPIEDKSGIRVDLIFAKLPYEEKAIHRAKKKRVNGETVRICSPEDLVLHKIVSDRPRDWEDIRGIISKLDTRLDRKYLDPIIRDLAKALAKPGLAKFYKDCFKRS